MKPVAIFRHSPTEGPGYFSHYLEERGVAWRLIRVDAGDLVPEDPGAFAGLVFMGGPMSVNDPLPWIVPTLALIRRAVDSGVPVLGHCLGGQLMSEALGGSVTRNPVKEIGWGPVAIAPDAEAGRWFGERAGFLSFHWHGETFTIPSGAMRLASSAHCENQAFALGPHLGMQFHVEMTPQMIRTWAAAGADEIAAARSSPAVQTSAEMETDLEPRTAELHAVARAVYDRWLQGLAR
jgi:GMP synthase-like glutamine amidotransferase